MYKVDDNSTINCIKRKLITVTNVANVADTAVTGIMHFFNNIFPAMSVERLYSSIEN